MLTLDDWQPSTREKRVNNRPKPRLLSSLPWYCLCDTVELVDQMKLSACWIYSNGIFIFHTKIRSRASSRSRLSAFVQISALFQIYITDMSRHLHHLTRCPFEVKKGGLKGLFLFWEVMHAFKLDILLIFFFVVVAKRYFFLAGKASVMWWLRAFLVWF